MLDDSFIYMQYVVVIDDDEHKERRSVVLIALEKEARTGIEPMSPGLQT